MSDPPPLLIRPVARDDAPAIAAIYRPYVEGSVITFEETAPDAAEMAARIALITATHPWLVAERAGRVIGYAYGSTYRARAAYRWVAEAGIYLDLGARGRGDGTTLYRALMRALAEQGYVSVIGSITMPNAASEALHRTLGFGNRCVQAGIGYKHGGWHDVAFWQLDLAPRPIRPEEPGPSSSPARGDGSPQG